MCSGEADIAGNDWFLAVTEGGRCHWVGRGIVQGTRQNEPDLPENARKLSCEIPRWQRGSAMGRVQAVFLKSIAVLSCCPVASLSATATLHLPALWEHVLLPGKVYTGKPWKQHSVLLASAIVRRSCPRGPSAEWFTSAAQNSLLFRVLLLQVVFSSAG